MPLRVEISAAFLSSIENSPLTLEEKTLAILYGGIKTFVFRRVLIRMPLKTLPVELDVAPFMNAGLVKYEYRNSAVVISMFGRMENTDSLISQSVEFCSIR